MVLGLPNPHRRFLQKKTAVLKALMRETSEMPAPQKSHSSTALPASQRAAQDIPGRALLPKEIHAIFGGLILAMFLGAVDQAIVAPVLIGIGVEMQDVGNAPWIVTAYMLSSTAAMPIVGKLSDMYGRKPILMSALLLVLAGSALCGLAPSMLTLVVGRAVQGLGGAGLMSLPNMIVADILSPRERGKYQVYISGTYGLAGLAGPIIGGLTAQFVSWRWIFLGQLPLVILAMIFCRYSLRHVPLPQKRGRVDAIGSALMVAANLCFLLALSWGGRIVPWDSKEIICLFAATIFFGFVLLRQQARSDAPIVPPSIIKNRVVAVTSVAALLVMAVNISFSVFFPIYLETGRDVSSSSAGLLLAGPLVAIVLGSYLSGQYMRASGRYRLAPILGSIVAATAAALMAIKLNDMGFAALFAMASVIGLGIGAILPPILVLAQNAVRYDHIGVTTGIHIFFRALGSTLGIAIFTAIVQALTGLSVGMSVHDTALAQDASQSAAIIFRDFLVLWSGVLVLSCFVLSLLPEIQFRAKGAAFVEVD